MKDSLLTGRHVKPVTNKMTSPITASTRRSHHPKQFSMSMRSPTNLSTNSIHLSSREKFTTVPESKEGNRLEGNKLVTKSQQVLKGKSLSTNFRQQKSGSKGDLEAELLELLKRRFEGSHFATIYQADEGIKPESVH